MYNKSIDKITLAKALGICLVVIGHSGCPSTVKNIIYLFHMPFFFFISGYCFKDKYLTDFRTFFKHRIKGLYFPFIKYTVIFILLHNLLFCIDIYNTEYGTGNGKIIYELSEFPHLIFAAFRFNTQEQLLGVFWFIKSLFFGYVVFWGLLRITKSLKMSCKWGGVILLISCFCLLNYSNVDIPYVGFRTLYPAFFITFGYIYKNEIENKFQNFRITTTLTGLVILIISSLYLKTEMLKVTPLSIFPYTLVASIGCVTFIQFSEIMSRRLLVFTKTLNYLGTHTFIIMALHFLSFKLVSLLIIFIYGYPYGMLSAFPTITYMQPNTWWGLYSFVGITVPLSIDYLVENFSFKK